MIRAITFIVCVFTLLFVGAVRMFMGINFSRGCSGYLERAATANTIPLAKENLDRAILHLESHNITSGYTSVLYNTPGEDVGFFYQNLVESRKVLSDVKPNASELEVSNTLLKLHNTLIRDGKDGQHTIQPTGISAFPYNFGLALTGFLAFFVGGICFLSINSES